MQLEAIILSNKLINWRIKDNRNILSFFHDPDASLHQANS